MYMHIQCSGARCNPQKLEVTSHLCFQTFVFFTWWPAQSPSSGAIIWSKSPSLKGDGVMKTSQIRHVTVCFETCIVVTRNIQWEVTLACSALRAPYTVRINPKTQPLSRDYWQEQQQRQTNRPKRFCPWNKSRLLWSLLLCGHAYFLSCMFKDFSLIVSVHSIRYEFIPNLPEFYGGPRSSACCNLWQHMQLYKTKGNEANTFIRAAFGNK